MKSGTWVALQLLKVGTIGSIIASIYLLGALHGLQIGAAAQTLGVLTMPPVDMRLPFRISGGQTYFPTATVLRYSSTTLAAAVITAIIGLLGASFIYIAPCVPSADD